MAVNIFDKYGIKEVANVYFEALEDDPKANVYKGDIVLYLDTLKVSTIETTAESVDATGGWGNPKLITWDYGTLTLEDALMSLESLRFMLGGAIKRPSTTEKVVVRHTEEVVVDSSKKVPLPKDHLTGKTLYPKATIGHPIRLINLTAGTRTQIIAETKDTDGIVMTADGDNGATNVIKFVNPAMGITEPTDPDIGDHIRIFWEEVLDGDNDVESAVEVTIYPDTYPGTYRVVGDTFMRSEKTGKDEAFQFVIGKAKVLSEVTLTLEAEGDPSTFEMTLNVLRSTNDNGENEMMKLIRYAVDEEASGQDIKDRGSLNGHGEQNPSEDSDPSNP